MSWPSLHSLTYVSFQEVQFIPWNLPCSIWTTHALCFFHPQRVCTHMYYYAAMCWPFYPSLVGRFIYPLVHPVTVESTFLSFFVTRGYVVPFFIICLSLKGPKFLELPTSKIIEDPFSASYKFKPQVYLPCMIVLVLVFLLQNEIGKHTCIYFDFKDWFEAVR